MACHTPSRLHNRVISLISTGASLLFRSFLWTTMKLTSDPLTTLSRMRICTGMAEMKAHSLPLPRMPTCHSFFHPGDSKALAIESDQTG